MKRLLAALGLATVGAAIGCWLKGWHDARRHPLGSFQCGKCKRFFFGLEDAGAMPDDRTTGMRSFSRDHGGTFQRGERWREDSW